MSERPPLYSTAEAHSPPEACTQWVTVGDTKLRAAVWGLKEPERAQNMVLLLGGRTEYIEKYFETISDLLERDFSVVTFDWRGQGLSSRSRENRLIGHIDQFDEFVSDLDAVMEEIIRPLKPARLILMGHSMGGHNALRYLQHRPTSGFDAAVVIAPMTGINTPGPFPGLVKGLAACMCALGKGGSFVVGGAAANPLKEEFDSNQVTSDLARFDRYKGQITSHQELALGAPSYGWLAAAFRSMKEVNDPDRLKSLTLPVLLASAGADTIVDSNSHDHVAAHLGNATHITIGAAKHEILNETDFIRAEFWRAFDGFVQKNVPQSGSQEAITSSTS